MKREDLKLGMKIEIVNDDIDNFAYFKKGDVGVIVELYDFNSDAYVDFSGVGDSDKTWYIVARNVKEVPANTPFKWSIKETPDIPSIINKGE